MTADQRALLSEALGAFLFIFVGAGSVVVDVYTGGAVGLVGIALAHGLALSVVVSIFGGVSGGHVNPAVTLALALARKFSWRLLLPYWIAQLLGGAAAGLLLLVLTPAGAGTVARLGTPVLGAEVGAGAAIGIEAILTLFLALAVFGTAVAPAAPRIAGFGIGLTVAADILMGGPLTGAAMNPARWFGPAVASGAFADWWIWWVGPLLGGAAAGLLYRFAFDVAPAQPPARP